MKKIYLAFKSTTLGYLCREEQGFRFYANEQSIRKIAQKNPILMRTFSLNISGNELYMNIPNLFSQFIPSKERVDLIKKAEIIETDDEFEKLYKIAGLNLVAINFKIHR